MACEAVPTCPMLGVNGHMGWDKLARVIIVIVEKYDEMIFKLVICRSKIFIEKKSIHAILSLENNFFCCVRALSVFFFYKLSYKFSNRRQCNLCFNNT